MITNNEKTSEANKQTVLVTGGTGFIGSWAIASLLEQGYKVRTTVRTLESANYVRSAIAKQVSSTEHLTFFAADLMRDEGWSKAVDGADYVLHVASPLGTKANKNIDLVPPALEGTLRVVQASIEAGVKRVVLTSSGVAANPAIDSSKNTGKLTIDESVWTDPNVKGIDNYSRAKTLAERAAWDLIAKQGKDTTLATVLPVFVQGPVLGKEFAAGSGSLLARFMDGKLPMLPKIRLNVVDVRDVVDMHIKAMVTPEAAGQRFIASSDIVWFSEIAAILREHLVTYAAKIPTRQMPDWLLKVAALFNYEVRGLVSQLNQERYYSSDKAQKLLGWKPRPIEQTFIDGAESLIKAGAV